MVLDTRLWQPRAPVVLQPFSMALHTDLYYALRPSAWIDRFMALDPWQRDLVDDRTPRIHANTSRQIGKSTAVAGKVWHRAWFRYGQLILLIAPTLRQSVELIRKVQWFAAESGCPASQYKQRALSIEVLHTGSRIIALPGGNPDNIRGFSGPQLVVIDEAAFAKDRLYRLIRPMLMTSHGQLVLISTPFTKTGFFYEIAATGNTELKEEWSRYTIPAWDCPRVSSEFLATERASMGDWYFNSEYGCKFQDPLDGIFAGDDIKAAFRNDVAPLYMTDAQPELATDLRGVVPLYQ